MKIAVMGAGALGGYFGGRLSAAGHDVTLIARGAHLAAIRKRGLTIRSPRGDLHLPDIRATDDPGQVGPVDVVLFMVKNYDVETSARAISAMLGPDTMVVTCQNGVSAPDRLAAVIGADHVVPGVVRMPAEVPEPGVINHSAPLDIFAFGEMSGEVSPRVVRLRDAIDAAGATAQVPPSILHDLWAKFVMQASFASITTLTRLDIGPLRGDTEPRSLVTAAMEETERVGRAVLPGLPADLVGKAWAILDSLPGTTHASMLDDLRAGKRIEVDYLSGDVVRLGRAQGVPTPIHEVFYRALYPFRDGAPGAAAG